METAHGGSVCVVVVAVVMYRRVETPLQTLNATKHSSYMLLAIRREDLSCFLILTLQLRLLSGSDRSPDPEAFERTNTETRVSLTPQPHRHAILRPTSPSCHSLVHSLLLAPLF